MAWRPHRSNAVLVIEHSPFSFRPQSRPVRSFCIRNSTYIFGVTNPMRLAFLDRLMNRRRRPMGTRHAANSRRPMLESMEDRRLLSTVPYMLIDNSSVVEGSDGGVTPMEFTVSLTSSSNKTVKVNYQTIGMTATAGSDFIPTSGQLTFSPGQTSRTITVGVVADTIPEPNESFYVALSGASNAMIVKPLGVGTIGDDDAAIAPEISINDVAIRRGLSGHRFMVFTVSLNTTNFSSPITVRASTTALTARAGIDFEPMTQTLTFLPGERTKEVAVKIFGTSTVTSDRAFYVGLSNANARLFRPNGGGVIRYGA